MPLFEYRCQNPDCKQLNEAFRLVENRNDPLPCSACGFDTRKIISVQRVHPDFSPYFDDNLQTEIQSKQHRKKVMKEQGVIEAYGKGWK